MISKIILGIIWTLLLANWVAADYRAFFGSLPLFLIIRFVILGYNLPMEEAKSIFMLIVKLSIFKLILDLVIKKILTILIRKRKKVKTINLIKRELTRLNEEFNNILSHKVLKDDFSEVNEVMIKIDQQVDFMEKEKEVMDMLFSTPNNIKTAIDINKLDKISNSIENLRDVPEIERLYELIEKIKEKTNKFTDFAKEAYEYINKMYFASRSGLAGEKRLNEELSLYRDVIKNLGSIRLEVENTTVESDSIVISENGVFCIEVKNYGDNSNSGKIVISKDGAWKRYNASGKEVPIHNVTAQIYRHIGIQQRFLNEELKKINAEDVPYVYFRPIIVIANDNIEIENNSDIPVLRISNVYHYIMNYKAEEKLDKKYWDVIEKILVENNKGLKPYPVKHYTPQILEVYEGLLSIVNDFEKIYYSVLEALHENKFNIHHYFYKREIKSINKFDKFYSQGNYEKALNSVPRKVKNKGYAYYLMGRCLEQLNQLNEAIDYYQKSCQYENRKANIYFRMGMCYFKLGKYNEALDSYNKSYNLEDNEMINKIINNIRMAEALLKLGRFEEASEKYTIAYNTLKTNELDIYGNVNYDNSIKIETIKGYQRIIDNKFYENDILYESVC